MSAVAWAQLTGRQREGMERDYWESLTGPQQLAFVDPQCWRGDGRPRFVGAMLCVEHLELLQEETAMTTGPDPTPEPTEPEPEEPDRPETERERSTEVAHTETENVERTTRDTDVSTTTEGE